VTDQSLQFPRFYVTAPTPCPYLPGRKERKVFTELRGAEADALNDALSRVGFRRSQSVAYRPACEGCAACISVRVLAKAFRPNRTMRRVLAKNRDIRISHTPPLGRMEQFALLRRYLASRHPAGGMADMDFEEYAEMVENTPVDTSLMEYRISSRDPDLPGRLVGTSLTDRMADGLSMVYSFYDPAVDRPSLGTYMILDHIRRAREQGLDYVYLGYWIRGSRKMAYKAKFKPLERLGPEGWFPFDEEKEVVPLED